MRKFMLSAALCALTLAASGQDVFRKTGKSVAGLHGTRTDETVVTVEADINKDGVKDLVIALDGYYSDSNFAFYFGDRQGNYNLFREYEVSMYGDKIGLSVTETGVVRIQLDGDGGADIFLFRWQDGDFRLIGGKKDRHVSDHYDESYNYLTGKMIRTDGEGGSRKAVTSDMPEQPVINFGWIPLCYDMLDYLVEVPEDEDFELTPDDMLVWGIFRVMQANEMLFGHFCDWEDPDCNPVPSEEPYAWYANDELLSPGSYNFWSTLDITRLEDGSYQLDLSETFYDRSYEVFFDEDLSNIDEVLEEYETDEQVSEERWIFRNGRFFPQEIPEPVAFEAYLAMVEAEIAEAGGDVEYSNGPEDVEEDYETGGAPRGSTVHYFEDTDDIEGYYESHNMDCFPLESGGWVAVYTWAGSAESEPTGYKNEAFTFIDGELTRADSFLPVPENLDDFLDPDACKGREELVARLKAAYAGNPRDWLAYHCDAEEQTMIIEFRPTDPYTEQYEKHIWTDECWDLTVGYDALPVYRWDGNRFMKQ